jgi:hypothetical protein
MKLTRRENEGKVSGDIATYKSNNHDAIFMMQYSIEQQQ